MSITLASPVDRDSFDRDGFAIIGDALSSARVNEVLAALPRHLETESRGGLRNLFEIPAVTDLARDPVIRGAAEGVLGADCFAVRALLFDKTPSANWKVAWHQDVTIAVAERRDVPGFGPWSVKAGVAHVQPPREILESMVAVRVHLDPCSAENGPVRVLAGSHRNGKLSPDAVAQCRAQVPEVACIVPRGGLLLMRPLLLHASSPAMVSDHRRVIHLEFASSGLAGGLVWRWRV